MKDWLKLIGVLILLFLAGLLVGRAVIHQTTCHSVTEDSTPYDCDYHDHEWRTR